MNHLETHEWAEAIRLMRLEFRTGAISTRR